MKLIDLNPRWAIDADIVIGGIKRHYPDRHGMCISFDCPHCVQQNINNPIRLAIWFQNPIDNLPPTDDASHLWFRTNETFNDITLMPSIDVSKEGHWHGYITNGEIK